MNAELVNENEIPLHASAATFTHTLLIPIFVIGLASF